jgi:hypothetical protein
MLTIEEYEAKRQARYERFAAAAEKAEAESAQQWKQARLMADVIPFGQPIHVGHYSEGPDRRYRARIESKHRKGYELHKKAEYYRSRADSAQDNTAIMSDDPSAVSKLTAKVEELEAEQREMKRINAALRKGADFDTLEMSETHRAELLSVERHQAYYQPRQKGFPPYALSNLSAKIRTAKERAQRVESKQAIPDKDERIGNVRIEWRAGENRIRIFYPGRVDLATFKKLQRHGYKVLRSEGEGAFSAFYNNNAAYFVKELREAAKA